MITNLITKEFDSELVRIGIDPTYYKKYTISGGIEAVAVSGVENTPIDEPTYTRIDFQRYFNGKYYARIIGAIGAIGSDSLWGEYTFVHPGCIRINTLRRGTVTAYFNEKGLLSREDGPALSDEANNSRPEWFYNGKKGLVNFPDDALAKIGDTII